MSNKVQKKCCEFPEGNKKVLSEGSKKGEKLKVGGNLKSTFGANQRTALYLYSGGVLPYFSFLMKGINN